jgi:hypothetical protein
MPWTLPAPGRNFAGSLSRPQAGHFKSMAIVARSRMGAGLALPRAAPLSDRACVTPLFLYFLGVILPSELAVNVFGMALIPVRVVLMVFFVPALLRLFRSSTARFQVFDYFLLMSLLWLCISLIVNNGFEKGGKFGGSLLLEALGGYLLARAYVRSYAQFAYAVRTYFLFVMVAAVVAFPETFFRIQFVHDWAAQISGLPKAVVGSEAGRLGLARANSTFDHPILYGVFCASALGLVWYLFNARRDRWIRAAALFAATLCSVSSAPLLAYFMIVSFILWERYSRQFANRVAIMVAIAVAMMIVIELVSTRSAAEVLISVVALDHWTAYYRLLIWQNAGGDVLANPLFGVALNAWTRPAWMTGSVDSFWLNAALMGGLPTVIFLGLSFLLLLMRVHGQRGTETRDRWSARFGWTATILALVLQAFTVHYWGSMNSLFFFLLGLGAWLTDSREGFLQDGRAAVASTDARMPARRGLNAPLLEPR